MLKNNKFYNNIWEKQFDKLPKHQRNDFIIETHKNIYLVPIREFVETNPKVFNRKNSTIAVYNNYVDWLDSHKTPYAGTNTFTRTLRTHNIFIRQTKDKDGVDYRYYQKLDQCPTCNTPLVL